MPHEVDTPGEGRRPGGMSRRMLGMLRDVQMTALVRIGIGAIGNGYRARARRGATGPAARIARNKNRMTHRL